MIIEELQQFLQQNFPEYSGYTIEFAKRPSKSNVGKYYIKNNRIVIHDRIAINTYRTDDVLYKCAIHELAHFVQYKYTENFVRNKGVMHDIEFISIFRSLLLKVYDEHLVDDYISSRFKKVRRKRG